MLNIKLKGGLAAVATATLLCTPVQASAALAPVDAPGTTATTDYLAQAMRHALATTTPPTLADTTTWFALPAAAMRSPLSVKLRASSDLALWHLVATVHAQQQNKTFDLVDAGTKTVWKLEHDNVSAVPLPGVVWLFVMGLLGIAGTRLKGKHAKPFGMAPAAA
jgi:hypothetical protein